MTQVVLAVRRELPFDVYDALDLVVLAFGGIGAGEYYEATDGFDLDDPSRPVCAIGCARFAAGGEYDSEIERALRGQAIHGMESDAAVRAINARKGAGWNARVTFAEWCAELNVVRGES